MASCVKKQGRFYVKDDGGAGLVRGLDPWAVENDMNLLWADEEGAEGFMPINARNRQQYGTVHGGVLVAFADTIAGHSLVAHGKMCVTQGSTVNFLRPASGQYLTCRAVPQQIGKHVCVVAVEQRNDRKELVTTALFTFVVVKEVPPLVLPKASEDN